jgi:tetratricopeptide (TPR) repeat protein
MTNFIGKIMVLMIVVLTCNSCTVKTAVTPRNEQSPNPSLNPSPIEPVAPDCLTSLSKITVQKDEEKSSKDVEAEGDKLEAQGKGQEALNKYSEAYLIHWGEKGYAAGRAMRGDPSASLELNTSIESPEFPFKVGRAFAKTEKHEIAISCFTESLNNKITSPNDASAYLNRGEAYLATGQKEKARQDYQNAAELFQKYKLPQYQKMATDRLRSVTP